MNAQAWPLDVQTENIEILNTFVDGECSSQSLHVKLLVSADAVLLPVCASHSGSVGSVLDSSEYVEERRRTDQVQGRALSMLGAVILLEDACQAPAKCVRKVTTSNAQL